MGDAAHGESLKHEVFHKPFEVKPTFELWATPSNYRRYPGGEKLPAKMKVWRVQQSGKHHGGVVARAWGFNDSPDAEAIVPGFNEGKEYGAVGIGRHGNVLQWGYASPPSRMTDAGQKLFLNCLCYIRHFDGKGPLIRRQRGDRINPIRLAPLIPKIKDKDFASRNFPSDLLKKYTGNPAALAKHYQDNYELVYWDKVYRIDEELKSLGITSNRRLKTLEQLIALLKNAQHHDTARRLLARYTEQTFRTPAEWDRWYKENRERIYFTDVGGFKFRVVPVGYLDGGK